MMNYAKGPNRPRHACGIVWFAAILLPLLSGCGREPTAQERDTTAALLSGNWPTVVSSGETWTARDGNNPVSHFVLSFGFNFTGKRQQQGSELRAAFADNTYTERVAHWGEALARENSGNPRAHWVYGVVLEQSGNSEGAGREYEKAVQIDPSFFDGYQSLGTLRLSRKDYEGALSYYKKTVIPHPAF